MNSTSDLWQTLTAPQATIIASIIAVIGAIFGLLLGWWLLNGRVRDLKTAIDHAGTIIETHRANVDRTLRLVEEQISGLRSTVSELESKIVTVGTLLQPIVEGVGKIQGSVSDLQSSNDQEVDVGGQPNPQQTLREDWVSIRDKLEEMANDPAVDGRTRAAYARIDRRSYADLINAISKGNGNKPEMAKFREAVALWHKYRTGRSTPPRDDVEKMKKIRAELLRS